ncbi:MAG: 3-hydroxyacyl-CoA dehydrogenase NAD-binding domain-containing protein [Pseudomonadota bacterium]|nr:3-hydroxyacyl-CoA dehydrogenase NAD-binding domain-containing protein [Pseudomonadota bacterium]
MGDVVEYHRHGAIAVIALNNPPVNALGWQVRQSLQKAVEKAAADADIKAVVLLGRGRGFCGGADIREFGSPRKEPVLTHLINAIEAMDKPVVAAIHGIAAGGGCEVPLGCHYRVADASAHIGLPEVKLGLLPGAGGTQRMPRLIGVGPALEAILSGDYIAAERAREMGLFDEIIDGDLEQGAIAFAKKLIADGHAPRRTRDIPIDANGAAKDLEKARADTARRARGLMGPLRCIESIENALTLPIDEGLAREREYFRELEISDQSRALRHLFFAEREAHRIPGVGRDTKVRPIDSAAVIGCGTMGRGIAMSFANAGLPVTVLEMDKAALDKGLAAIRDTYAGSVARGSLSQEQMNARLKLIDVSTDYADIAGADIVIEAVFEDMDLKKKIFSKLDQVCRKDAILATNTSSLDVDEIASATKRPQDVIGTHFFSPANVMKLMENVRGEKTAPDVIATVMKLSKDLEKVGVMVGVCDGFVGNRMLYAYRGQADFLLEQGALPQQVDKVIYDFGFPMGPFAMGDLAGLDVGYKVRQHRRKTRPSNDRYSVIADRIVESGRLGQKTGKGWYLYEKGSRTPVPDPEIEKLIAGVSREMGIERRPVTNQEILERCLYPLINEGAKILGEGIAIRPSDVDLVWVYGYGFPRGKGGPMFHADVIGVKTVHEKMQRLYAEHGEMLRPAPLLEELAASGKSFAQWQADHKIT